MSKIYNNVVNWVRRNDLIALCLLVFLGYKTLYNRGYVDAGAEK